MAYPFDGAIYDQIAWHYDDLHFWTERVRAASGPVLELGLGTGRLAIPLAREANGLLWQVRLELAPSPTLSMTQAVTHRGLQVGVPL